MSRRAGIYDKLEDRLKANQFGGEEEALAVRREEERRRRVAEAHETEHSVQQVAAVQRPLFAEIDTEAGMPE